MRNNTAPQEWTALDARRTGQLDKVERLAEVTLPHVCTDDNYDSGQDALTNGTTSLGAQAVTHLINKLVMAMFPNRPFYRLAIAEAEARQLVNDLGVPMDQLTDLLAQAERDSVLQLEMTGSRNIIYEIITHLVVAGDVMLDLSDKEELAAIPIREYCVRRDTKGRPCSIVIKQCYYYDELEEGVQRQLPPGRREDDDKHDVYTWIKVKNGKMHMSKWVDSYELPEAFGAIWSREDCPFIPLTWRLPLRQDYGVSRVEEYYSDLSTYEIMSESMRDGSILAAQYRWLQNPSGLTRPEDFANSRNGDIIPGNANDLALVTSNIGNQLSTVMQIADVYSRRIGAGFLMNSAMTRDAERVTAEEIRLQAMELEGSLGGVYSRLAKEIQQPLARWLMRSISLSLKGTKITPVVITGLDALSRNADLERLTQFLNDVTALGQIPPQQRAVLQESAIISDMAAGRGINKSRYIASDEEIQQRMAALAEQEAAGSQAPVPTA